MKKILLPILLLFATLTTAQQVTTFAGTYLGNGYLDGDVSTAMFSGLKGICADNAGNIYVVDGFNYKIRKINTTGIVTTLAGSTEGFADGLGTTAKFGTTSDICINAANTHLFVADSGNHRIRKIEISTGMVTTFAGSTAGHADGMGAVAKFEEPFGLCIATDDTIYVADWIANKIRKISPLGLVNTIAGSTWGFADGVGTAAQFKSPTDVCIDALGNLYVADSTNSKIRKITTDTTVTTIAGSDFGLLDGPLLQAKFRALNGICIDQNNNLYVIGDLAHNIRKIDLSSGLVSTFVGSTTGVSGNIDGIGTQALLRDPYNLCLFGNDIYFTSFCCSVIKKVIGVLANESFTTIQSVLYPNPTSGTFTIETPNTIITSVNIYDVLGKMVFTENTDVAFSYTYKNSMLKQGLYLVVVVTEKGNFTKQLMVH
jgi:sugar lactone lactonase YvrE